MTIHLSGPKSPQECSLGLTKNENIQATSDQCATCQMKSSEPLGKKYKNMDQMNKTNINDTNLSYVHEKK